MFVYKHTETIEYVIKNPTFEEKYKPCGRITREFLGLRMRNFEGIILYELKHIERSSNLH